jgi:hypothetical protein
MSSLETSTYLDTARFHWKMGGYVDRRIGLERKHQISNKFQIPSAKSQINPKSQCPKRNSESEAVLSEEL